MGGFAQRAVPVVGDVVGGGSDEYLSAREHGFNRADVAVAARVVVAVALGGPGCTALVARVTGVPPLPGVAGLPASIAGQVAVVVPGLRHATHVDEPVGGVVGVVQSERRGREWRVLRWDAMKSVGVPVSFGTVVLHFGMGNTESYLQAFFMGPRR